MRALIFLVFIALGACQAGLENEAKQQEPINLPVEKVEEQASIVAEEIPFLDRFNQSLGDSISVRSIHLDIDLPYKLNDSLIQRYIAYYDSAKGYRHEDLGSWFPIAKTEHKNYYSLFFGMLGDSEAILQINYSKADSSEIDRLFVAETYHGCAEYEEFHTVVESKGYRQLHVAHFIDEKPDSSLVFYQLSDKGRFRRVVK